MALNLSKSLQRELRSLAGLGYERSLAVELKKLDDDFTAWKAGDIDPFELSEKIHKFHNGPSRDLFVRFNLGGMKEVVVAGLIVDGLLAESDVSPELLSELSDDIERIRSARKMDS